MLMATHNLFPTPVGQFNLDRDLTPEEIQFIQNQTTHKNTGNSTSDDRYVLKHEVMADIAKFINTAVGIYFKTIYAPKNEVTLRVTQSWFNYSKPNEWHHKHSHANSFISGVFYPKAMNEEDRIYFYKEGYAQIQVTPESYNLYNSSSWWLPVKTGSLMLFPSGFTHAVDPVKGDNERISLAFNTFLVGYVGEENTLTALHL